MKFRKRAGVFAAAVLCMFTCLSCGQNGQKDQDSVGQDTQKNNTQIEDFTGEDLDDGKAGSVYTLIYKSGEEYENATRPESHFQGATAAFSGMRVDNITVRVKFYEDGTYKYVATDNSAVDTTDERWMHREYVWTGAYTAGEQSYTLAAPDTASLIFKGGPAYVPMASLIGELGTFTHETNPELLTMFEEAIAEVQGDTITFTLLHAKADERKPQEGQIRVACIGDSITYGHGVDNWETDNYPAVLQQLLGDAYFVENFGCIGACVNPDGDKPYTEQSVYQKSLDYDADIIIIMLGTNDSKSVNWKDKDSFVKAYEDLLESYKNGEKNPIIYIGVCAESFTLENPEMDYGIRPEIVDEIAEAIRGSKLSDGAELIDIHELTEKHPQWFLKDGVHPDSEGAKQIAQAVADAIR